jgi:hypothetical protein
MTRFRPSPALVISLIALFVALGGTSYAAYTLPANSVGTKQLKNAAVTGPKIKNGSVTASKINAAGLTVPSADHATSADSATSAGTALSPGTLPSGKTEIGTYAIDFTDSSGSTPGSVAITFPFPLASAPSVGGSGSPDFIASGGQPTVDCPGSAANPQAASGHLCVYELYSSKVLARCVAKTTDDYVCDATSKWGAVVNVQSTTAGRVTSVGTWAVTAP